MHCSVLALRRWLAAACTRRCCCRCWRWLLYCGALDALSLLKEYANRQDVFQAALGRHLQIVGATLAAALLIGLPLGVAAARAHAWPGPCSSC